MIWNKLPKQYKGNFFININNDKLEDYHLPKETTKIILCKSDKEVFKILKKNNRPLVVANISDAMTKTEYSWLRLILVNHGAGQSYIGEGGKRNKSYAGGYGRHNVALFLNPNDYSNKLDEMKYPYAEHIVVGCPKMDEWHLKTLSNQINKWDGKSKPVIAISFHWDCHVVPETRSAWEHFKSAISGLADNKDWIVLGHGHPRILDELSVVYESCGIEVVRRFDDVLERANLYVADHMSTLYEFASTDRPVVVLNAPWYRRDVNHGLRFWDCANVGVNCNSPGSLIKKIYEALEDSEEQKKMREDAVNTVYKYRDGQAAQRSVEVIEEYLLYNFKWETYNKRFR